MHTFVALGQAKISLFMACLRKIILLIPLIFILPLFLPEKTMAVFLAEPIADIIAAAVTTTMFFRFFKKMENWLLRIRSELFPPKGRDGSDLCISGAKNWGNRTLICVDF